MGGMGHHEDFIRAQAFEEDYMDSWFTWAQKNRLVKLVGESESEWENQLH